jgi:predicted dehydrogenase
MEKPFCRDLEEADQIVDAFDSRHLKLAIAHQSRYSPIVKKVKELIAAGTIGDVLELRARGKEDRRGGGEDLWVLGTHMLDLMRVINGDVISCSASVWANGRPIRKSDVVEGAEGIGPLAGDWVSAMYRFENGVTGYFGSRRNEAGRPTRFGLEIYGSKGVFQIASGYTGDVEVLIDSSWSPGRTNSRWQKVSTQGIGKPETLQAHGNHTGNVRIVESLIEAIEKDTQPDGNVHDARAATEMIAAIFDAARRGETVRLPLKNRKNPLTMLDE